MISIGGEFELDPLTLAGGPALPEALQSGNGQELLRSGRGAIRRAVELSGRAGTWLLPSYLCDSVKQPFDELGLAVAFFRIGEDARIDADHLRVQVARYQPAGVLFINYFGMPLLPAEQQALADARQAGCFLIEDATHGSALEGDDAPAGRLGDLMVSSLRKYLPVPDGALLRAPRPGGLVAAAPAADAPAAQAFGRQRALAKLMRWEFLHGVGGSADTEAVFMSLFGQAEKMLDTSAAVYAASPWAAPVLAAQNLAAVRERRRRNFEALLAEWQCPGADLAAWTTPLYTDLPAGASPFAFPVLLAPALRDDLRRALVRERLYCPVLWPLPEAIDSAEFAPSYRLSARIMCIPLDQRYTTADMAEVVQRLRRVAETLRG